MTFEIDILDLARDKHGRVGIPLTTVRRQVGIRLRPEVAAANGFADGIFVVDGLQHVSPAALHDWAAIGNAEQRELKAAFANAVNLLAIALLKREAERTLVEPDSDAAALLAARGVGVKPSPREQTLAVYVSDFEAALQDAAHAFARIVETVTKER